MTDSTNYPDILGLITGGDRCNIGTAQFALAVRPHILRAGHPFEVLLLVQNCADLEQDLTLTLHLPNTDARRQRDRFTTKTQRLVVSVKRAEVGYVRLPVTTLPDTAVSDQYKIGVEIDVKPMGKPNRIRSAEGGGKFTLEHLTKHAQSAIKTLQSLSYSTSKRLGRSIIDAPITVMSGRRGQTDDAPAPGWVSVCKVSDYQDKRLQLHCFGPLVQVNTLPQLKKEQLFQPLLETTQARFAAAGYPLQEGEAQVITKLLTLILEYATPRVNAHGSIAARIFDIEGLLARDPFTLEHDPVFPHWFHSFLGLVETDERVAAHPAQVITRYLYDDLLRDAINYSFDLVATSTGENVGDADERTAYREHLISRLNAKSGLDFNRVYLPLVMGGLLINDQFALSKENPADLLKAVGSEIETRLEEVKEQDDSIYVMTNAIILRVGQRYGF